VLAGPRIVSSINHRGPRNALLRHADARHNGDRHRAK
jgi:hypothetical protein